jgi:hypothetical protein
MAFSGLASFADCAACAISACWEIANAAAPAASLKTPRRPIGARADAPTQSSHMHLSQ